MTLEEFLECIDDELHPLVLAIINWANCLDLDFYNCYSCKTKRISFRVPYKDNGCKTRNAFLTIVLTGPESFKYLLNGVGVDMIDDDNWKDATNSTLKDAQFNNSVIANYNLRLNQLEYKESNEENTCPNLDNFIADSNLDIVKKYHFKKIGSYMMIENKLECELAEGVNKSSKFKMVYALISENKVKYIGETKNGYERASYYHKNKVMGKVKNGIINQVLKKEKVDIYVRCKGFEFDEDSERGLPKMNLYKAVEKSLIEEFQPEWNKDK